MQPGTQFLGDPWGFELPVISFAAATCHNSFAIPSILRQLNHILVLPNLVKFCEICESRDHIKWIKERCLKLQEQVAMDDTISHQVSYHTENSSFFV